METNTPEVFAGKSSFVNFGFQQYIVTKGKLRLDKAAADQAVRKVFDAVGSPPAYLDGPEFAKFMETDNARLITAVRKVGMIEGKLE